MIAHLAGSITEKFQTSVILDVHGVGYELSISAPDAEKISLGDEVKFYTYHAIRENSEELFGFSSLAAKKMFQMLISVNGVGPKAAMAILSLGSTEEVRNAIANTDATFIAKAAGVGKKSAERVIVDLRDKVGAPSHTAPLKPNSLFPPPLVPKMKLLMPLLLSAFHSKRPLLPWPKLTPPCP